MRGRGRDGQRSILGGTLLELNDDDLYHSVSLVLGVKYSSKTDCLSRCTAIGCMFGPGRILMSLPIKMATTEGRNVHPSKKSGPRDNVCVQLPGPEEFSTYRDRGRSRGGREGGVVGGTEGGVVEGTEGGIVGGREGG